MADPAIALPNRLKAALAATLKGLDLDRIGDHVYEQMIAEDSNISFPCLLCTDDGLTERLLDGTTEHMEREWPVQVSLVVRAGLKQDQVVLQLRDWRQTIQDFFHQQRRPGLFALVFELQWIRLEMRLIVDPKLAELQRVVSGLTFWFRTLQPRVGPN